ncbi:MULTISPECIES: ABC transporter permease [Enterocloster]|uniref:NitT/TauT family transport system permease protein n=1 Tax=Enterocloster lavalensis TaxID=460384 RepID=A0A1I0EHI3_9FIRM|nr:MULTISPECIES: ABC transporter permease [Enterocloster]MCB6346620.1 ABC transporter permease [Enterocloster lavalensis]MDR3759294.1 ABC transporter permease [Enterocloster sp.]PST34748.1 ABC transporter permease [Enterocloster lavalensis]SET44640.1 NitT/TauT family transport system permease protein [Enterocloster lavalensis]
MGEKQTYSQSEQKRRERRLLLALSFGTLAAALVIWQLLVSAGIVSSRFLPAPTAIVNTFFEKIHSPNPEGATLQMNLLSSLRVALIGFVMAVVIGIPLGLFMGWYEPVDRLVRPVFEVIRPIPPIAWIPLTILFLGIGLRAKVFIIFFSAFVPCVINAYTGIQLTNRTLINVAKTYGAGSFEIFWRVGIPSSVQMIFAGIRIALGLSWTTLVAAEMLAADAGLGYMILMGRQFARPDIIVLGMVVIGTIGAVFSAVLSALEKRLEHWRAGR